MSLKSIDATRVWITVSVLCMVGAVVAAGLLVRDRAFTPSQVAGVTAACPQCHGNAPAYNGATLVHDKHAAFDCSHCHGGNRDLAASDGVHTGLKWFGAGAVLVVLTGIALNSFVINKKGKAR